MNGTVEMEMKTTSQFSRQNSQQQQYSRQNSRQAFKRQNSSSLSAYSAQRQSSLVLGQSSVVLSINDESEGDKYLRQGFKYLFLFTKLAGLVFHKPTNKKWTWGPICSVILYTFLLAITWGNVIRYFWVYEPNERFSPELMVKVSIHVLYFFSAFTYSTCISMSLHRSHVLHLWSSYYIKHNLSPRMPAHILQQRTIALLTVIFIFWLVTIAFQLLEPLTNSPFGLLSMQPFVREYKHISEVPVLYSIAQSFVNSLIYFAHSLYQAWIVIVGLALKDEYARLTKDCVECEELNDLDLEAIRVRHLDLSTLVQEIDGMISIYILVLFICNVPCCCIEIYLLLLWNLSVEYKLILLCSLFISLFMILTVIFIGTWLNEKVRCGSMRR